MKTATRYFISAGNMDAVRGIVLSDLDKLPLWAQNAYRLGQSFAKPATYTYKLTRRVDILPSGTRVYTSKRVPVDAKGLVDMIETVSGCHFQLPVSRLVAV